MNEALWVIYYVLVVTFIPIFVFALIIYINLRILDYCYTQYDKWRIEHERERDKIRALDERESNRRAKSRASANINKANSARSTNRRT